MYMYVQGINCKASPVHASSVCMGSVTASTAAVTELLYVIMDTCIYHKGLCIHVLTCKWLHVKLSAMASYEAVCNGFI